MPDGLDVAAVYLASFAARTDAYSVPMSDAKGWHVSENADGARLELTPEVIRDGLTRKGPSVSSYLPRPDNLSHVFAIDFDTETGAAQANRLGDAMAKAGVPAYVEGSRRGAHLWAVCLDPIPARVIRRAIRTWLQDAGFGGCPGAGMAPAPHPRTGNPACPACGAGTEKPRVPLHPDPKIELRPTSDEIYPDEQGRPGLGTCLRMPMMPHPKTGKRYVLAGVGGEKLGDSVGEILLALELADPKLVEDAAARWVPPKIGKDDVPRRYTTKREPLPDNDSASDILRDLWGAQNARPGKAIKCPAHDDREPSLSILRDDQRAICRGGGCILNNNGRGRGTMELRKLAPRQPS